VPKSKDSCITHHRSDTPWPWLGALQVGLALRLHLQSLGFLRFHPSISLLRTLPSSLRPLRTSRNFEKCSSLIGASTSSSAIDSSERAKIKSDT
jgi:hypothetical protein